MDNQPLYRGAVTIFILFFKLIPFSFRFLFYCVCGGEVVNFDKNFLRKFFSSFEKSMNEFIVVF